MDAEMIDLIQERVNALLPGATFDVKTLMGDDWASVKHKQSFGRKFKAALIEGNLAGVEHYELNNSPRRGIYKKI